MTVRLQVPMRILQVEEAIAKRLTRSEVGALGVMKLIDPGSEHDPTITYRLMSIHFPEQICSMGGQRMTDMGMHEWLTTNVPEAFEDVRSRPNIYRWHTHPQGVFFSDTDKEGLRNRAEHGGVVFSTCQNKQDDVVHRADFMVPGTNALITCKAEVIPVEIRDDQLLSPEQITQFVEGVRKLVNIEHEVPSTRFPTYLERLRKHLRTIPISQLNDEDRVVVFNGNIDDDREDGPMSEAAIDAWLRERMTETMEEEPN